MTTFEMTPLRDGSGLHLLYLHGGGYVNELLRPHWSIVENLAKRTGATVHIP
jgi:acetyl esterase/lipase